MPQPLEARWNDGVSRWNDGVSVWGPVPEAAQVVLVPAQPIALTNPNNAMEYWEITKSRAQETLPVWTQYLPDFKVGGKGTADLTAAIDGFEPLVQARTDAQDSYDACFRAAQDALLRMKVLGTRVPAMIEAQLDENAGIMKDVDDLYATSPRTESSILKRLRMLLPVWVRADAALAAMTPAGAPITRAVGGVSYTAAAAKTLLEAYTAVVNDLEEKQSLLDQARMALRAHDRSCDQLNKRWYKAVKAGNDPGSEVYEALSGITTEPSTPVPETIEINTVLQGGESGLEIIVSYVPGGGDHATTKLVKWQVVGVDAGFDQSAPLDASGNILGPFTEGQTVKVITEVSNSVGTRTTAPRTIVIGPPVG